MVVEGITAVEAITVAAIIEAACARCARVMPPRDAHARCPTRDGCEGEFIPRPLKRMTPNDPVAETNVTSDWGIEHVSDGRGPGRQCD